MKQIRNNTLLAMAAAALLAAGCTKSDGEGPAHPHSDGAIAPTATVRTITKAAVEGNAFPVGTANVFRLTAYRGTAAPRDWRTPYFSDVAVNSDAAGVLNLATPHYYPAGDDKLYFYAYAPEATSFAHDASGYPNAYYTITGQEDIMYAKVDTGIAKTVGGAQVQPALAFTHRLMQVRFKVVADPSYVESGKTKKVTEIEIKNLRTSAKLRIDNGYLAFDGNYDQSLALPITAGTRDEIVAGGTEMNGSVMCEPISGYGGSGILYLKVTADGVVYDDIPVKLTGPGVGAAGTSHLVTLTFKSSGIATTATIFPWLDDGEAEAQPQPAPAKLFYGDAANNGGVTTGLQGSTTSSYNSFTGTVAAGTNGKYFATVAEAFAGEKVYYQLEVALEDEPARGNWVNAMNACQIKTTDGGGWRLPRASEGRLMFLNHSSLEKTPGFTPFSTGRWSGTESDVNSVWVFSDISSGGVSLPKTNGLSVRCVREIPVPPAKMYYGGTNGTVITDLQGSTTSSYNSFVVGNNGPGYGSAAAAFAGEKGYYKLEVAPVNELNPADGTEKMNWESAMNICQSKTTDGTGWRLPRLSELKLMYLNKALLEATPGFTAFPGSGGGGFWSGTEYSSSSNAWYLYFLNGNAFCEGGKGSNFYVRCVREL